MVTFCYNLLVRIISRRILREFWEIHPDASVPLQTWFHDVERATRTGPADIKAVFRNASFLANNRVVFNIKGNRYRLIVVVVYQHDVVYIRFVGTHREYDQIDAATI
jgi:mRNA interferase HigB